MTLFELLFGFSTIILGLALTNIAASLHRLALAGRKVKWAPEPLMLATIIVMVIVVVWLGSWYGRDIKSINQGRALLDVVRWMALYFAAASCLPEPDLIGDDGIDLNLHYYDTRKLTYGAMFTAILTFDLYVATSSANYPLMTWLTGDAIAALFYAILFFARARWVHLVLLSVIILVFGYQVVTSSIA